jgi:hypothetical protein
MRWRLSAFTLLLFFLIAVSAAAADPARDFSSLVDSSRDEVVRVALVPSEEDPHAEVRLVRRGAAAVMQTLIVSRLLKRVVGQIHEKETSLWPPERKGHKDAARYVDALERAYRTVEGRFRKQETRGDRRRKMLIEFILSGETAIVAFLDPDIEGDFGGFRIGRRELLEILPLSRHYVRENMHEISIDSMDLSRREAEEMLKPLLPPALQQEGEKRERDEK